MFSNWFLKSFRILLLPFALLYGVIVIIRNWLYDKNILKSTSFGLPLICVGNLSVGGTGKSPMVEYLVQLLKADFNVAVLSRGYKRKTRGYALATSATTALEVGDEPMQFHYKFPDVPVAVGEERLEAIPQLLHDKPETEVVILDDAFQHRAIKAGLNILLTDCGNLFTDDFYLPTGDLRDSKSSHKRADIIIITKCSSQMRPEEKAVIAKGLDLQPHQTVFFTTIRYGTPYHITQHRFTYIDEHTDVLLLTGIANPKPLQQYLEERINTYFMLHYSDHHIFTFDDWKEIKKRFQNMDALKKIILTTEKDATRLLKYESELTNMPLYVIPIEHQFLFGEGPQFNDLVSTFIHEFKQPARL